jgi:hypothetical protein
MTDYGETEDKCPPDFVIDPDDTDSFEFLLAGELDGDTIDTYEIVLPDGLTLESSTNTDTSVTALLSGAHCGTVYRVTCRYTTAAGRTRDKTMRLIGREQ